VGFGFGFGFWRRFGIESEVGSKKTLGLGLGFRVEENWGGGSIKRCRLIFDYDEIRVIWFWCVKNQLLELGSFKASHPCSAAAVQIVAPLTDTEKLALELFGILLESLRCIFENNY